MLATWKHMKSIFDKSKYKNKFQIMPTIGHW